MRRSPWFRSLAILLAAWLPLIAGEPGLLHPCPMHGAGHAVMASLRGESAPASHPMAHHMAAGNESHQSQAPSHDHHNCTCIGGCTVASAAFLAPSAPTAEIVVAEY